MIRFWFCTLGDQEKALLKKEFAYPCRWNALWSKML